MRNTTAVTKSRPKISFRSTTRAVNTVIAVLLMVAIAVGVTAAAYFYINSMFDVEEPPLTEFLLYKESDTLRVISGPSGEALTWEDIEFNVEGFILNDDLTGEISAGSEFSIVDWVCSDGIPVSDDVITVKVRQKSTNRLIAMYDFTNPGCGVQAPAGGSGSDPWWDAAWSYRRIITIDHTKVSSDLLDFPVLITMDDPDLRDHAEADARDIVFTTADGTIVLNHEIEMYDSITGSLTCWVQLPEVSASEDTEFYMYYGNDECGDQQHIEEVWDNDYVTVQHLQEISGTHYDSTRNNNDGSSQGSEQNNLGKIGGANRFDAIEAHVSIPDSGSLNSVTNTLTIEGWFSLSDLQQYNTIVEKGVSLLSDINEDGVVDNKEFTIIQSHFSKLMSAPPYSRFELTGEYKSTTQAFVDILDYGTYNSQFGKTSPLWFVKIIDADDDGNHKLVFSMTGTSTQLYSSKTFTKDDVGNWYHFAAVYDGSSSELYINGKLDKKIANSGTIVDNNYPLNIGSDNTHRTGTEGDIYWGNYNGAIDEIRISNTPRDVDWIVTSYANQNNPNDFLTVGPEE